MRSLIVLLIVVPLVGCGRSGAPRTQTPSPTASATHIPGATSLYDLKTFQKTYSVGGLGRIPAGMANSVSMQLAGVRAEHFNFGAVPTDTVLYLSIVLGAPVPALLGMDGSVGATYQWWFYTAPETDAATASPDHVAQLKIAVRFVDGAWGVYRSETAGWTALPDAALHFGEHEITAKVVVDPAWGWKADDSVFFRAVAEVDGVYTPPIQDIGDVYPPDLTWFKVWR